MDLVHLKQAIVEQDCLILSLYGAAIRIHGAVGAEALGVDEEIAQVLQRLTDNRIRLAREQLGAAPVFGIRRSAALLAALEHADEAGTEDLMLAARAKLGER